MVECVGIGWVVVGVAVVVVVRLPNTLTRLVFRRDRRFTSQITATNKPCAQMEGRKEEKEEKFNKKPIVNKWNIVFVVVLCLFVVALCLFLVVL